MDLISQFVSRYRKEYDFYEQSCRITAQILDSNLESAGIRAIVTSRAKNPVKLENKIRQRANNKIYKTLDDIYEDIVDLAGVRVALYFPAEREEVGKIIRSLFIFTADPVDFSKKEKHSPHPKIFSGYGATHYRIRLHEKSLSESQKRYREANIEIQVASVLMHAWAEVEHDLVYKPLQGQLSKEEYLILDELNGLVLAGEIALERLQGAGDQRVSTNKKFTNHYDLASSLLDIARDKLIGVNLNDAVVGRVDLLFKLLEEFKLNTHKHLTKYVDVLHTNFEQRSLAEQIVDQVLSEDTKRYASFENIRLSDASKNILKSAIFPQITQNNEAIGQFMMEWIRFEKTMRAYYKTKNHADIKTISLYQQLRHLDNILPKELINTIFNIRHFRNQLVHGIEVPSTESIEQQTTILKNEVDKLSAILQNTKIKKTNSKNKKI